METKMNADIAAVEAKIAAVKAEQALDKSAKEAAF